MRVKFEKDFKQNFRVFKDKTVLNLTTNKIEFFSVEKFKKYIAEGDCCFICGAKPNEKIFNDEHVMPDWVLRKFKLHNDEIVLPNRTTHKYGNFKIPCCKDCNTIMGRDLEIPVSRLFNNGYNNFIKYLNENGPSIIHNWLYLLYIKIHLKHKYLRLFQDRREPNYKISDLTDWESLHHIHCMARAFYTKVKIDDNVWGTLIIFKAKKFSGEENFDYGDSFQGRGIFIRINDICLISILNDSFISINYLQHFFQKMKGALTPLQIREFFSRLVHVNMNLNERPIYVSTFDHNNGYRIQARLPKKLDTLFTETYPLGDIYYHFCSDLLQNPEIDNREYKLQKIKEGKLTFILNEKGEFLNH